MEVGPGGWIEAAPFLFYGLAIDVRREVMVQIPEVRVEVLRRLRFALAVGEATTE